MQMCAVPVILDPRSVKKAKSRLLAAEQMGSTFSWPTDCQATTTTRRGAPGQTPLLNAYNNQLATTVHPTCPSCKVLQISSFTSKWTALLAPPRCWITYWRGMNAIIVRYTVLLSSRSRLTCVTSQSLKTNEFVHTLQPSNHLANVCVVVLPPRLYFYLFLSELDVLTWKRGCLTKVIFKISFASAAPWLTSYPV